LAKISTCPVVVFKLKTFDVLSLINEIFTLPGNLLTLSPFTITKSILEVRLKSVL
jgi:hypothetical protein